MHLHDLECFMQGNVTKKPATHYFLIWLCHRFPQLWLLNDNVNSFSSYVKLSSNIDLHLLLLVLLMLLIEPPGGDRLETLARNSH